MMKKKVLSVKSTDLLRDALKYMKVKCSIDDSSREGMKVYQRCMRIWGSCFANQQLHFLVGELGRECIDVDGSIFQLGGQQFTCHLLEQTDLLAVTGAILYLFHAPEVDMEGREPLERFYMEAWQIALLDAARLWLERYLRRQQPEGQFLSESFGPGFYGMEMEAVRAMVEALDGEQIGISLLPDGMMEPAKSVVGMFLTGISLFPALSGDCLCCQSSGNCQMCRHYSDQKSVYDGGKL